MKINHGDKSYLWFISITKFHMIDRSVEFSSTWISLNGQANFGDPTIVSSKWIVFLNTHALGLAS